MCRWLVATREKAFALLNPGDVVHGLDLVLARPPLRGTQRIQAIGVGARIGVRHDLTTFLVIGSVGDPPLDLFGWKRDFEFRKDLVHIQSRGRCCCVLSRHGKAPVLGPRWSDVRLGDKPSKWIASGSLT